MRQKKKIEKDRKVLGQIFEKFWFNDVNKLKNEFRGWCEAVFFCDVRDMFSEVVENHFGYWKNPEFQKFREEHMNEILTKFDEKLEEYFKREFA